MILILTLLFSFSFSGFEYKKPNFVATEIILVRNDVTPLQRFLRSRFLNDLQAPVFLFISQELFSTTEKQILIFHGEGAT